MQEKEIRQALYESSAKKDLAFTSLDDPVSELPLHSSSDELTLSAGEEGPREEWGHFGNPSATKKGREATFDYPLFRIQIYNPDESVLDSPSTTSRSSSIWDTTQPISSNVDSHDLDTILQEADSQASVFQELNFQDLGIRKVTVFSSKDIDFFWETVRARSGVWEHTQQSVLSGLTVKEVF